MKTLLLACLALLAATQAHARPVSCSLDVAGRAVFAGGDCDFSAHGRDGSFQLTAPRGDYFVQLNMDAPGVAKGYWNGWGRGSHAHDDLGTLTRDRADPACWSNNAARVCAR